MEGSTYKMLYDAPIGKMLIVSNGQAIIEIDHVNHFEAIDCNPDELCLKVSRQHRRVFCCSKNYLICH